MPVLMSAKEMTAKKKFSEPRTHLVVYDGAIFAGVIDQHRDGKFRAYDSTGMLIGSFGTQHDASRAISDSFCSLPAGPSPPATTARGMS
jgi:hypothetical protein